MEYKIYTYLREYILLYPGKAATVTLKELELFIAEKEAVLADGSGSRSCRAGNLTGGYLNSGTVV